MGGRRQALLLMDANVLIDFLDSDPSVLRLVSSHVGQVHVPTPILQDEILLANDVDWTELGVVAVEPSFDLVREAARPRPGLAFCDVLCLLLAQESGWACVTNDRKLRRACAEVEVQTVWGLELVAWLVEAEALPAAAAEQIAATIQAANPGYVTSAVMRRFELRVRAVRPGPRRR